ncbi:MerR family DNA-binding transcriptional regulator [Paenibacillus riograndensis]|nr:MerR family DNA-binding transcriptional regulator [Paenibacillus riograndensis]
MDNLLSIQEMSRLTGLSAHTLRYYEKVGMLEGVARNE